MPATLHYFSIDADDLPRAKAFYERVLGWTLRPWGPPGYYEISIAGVPTAGLSERHEFVPGRRTNAFRTTFEVDDIDATLAAVTANGGRVLMQPHQIEDGPIVGYFDDTEQRLRRRPEPATAPAERTTDAATLRHQRRRRRPRQGVLRTRLRLDVRALGTADFYQVRNAGEGLRGALNGRGCAGCAALAQRWRGSMRISPLRFRAGDAASWGPAAAAAYPAGERLPLLRQPAIVLRPRDEYWEATARGEALVREARRLDLPDYDGSLLESSAPEMSRYAREFFDR